MCLKIDLPRPINRKLLLLAHWRGKVSGPKVHADFCVGAHAHCGMHQGRSTHGAGYSTALWVMWFLEAHQETTTTDHIFRLWCLFSVQATFAFSSGFHRGVVIRARSSCLCSQTEWKTHKRNHWRTEIRHSIISLCQILLSLCLRVDVLYQICTWWLSASNHQATNMPRKQCRISELRSKCLSVSDLCVTRMVSVYFQTSAGCIIMEQKYSTEETIPDRHETKEKYLITWHLKKKIVKFLGIDVNN